MPYSCHRVHLLQHLYTFNIDNHQSVMDESAPSESGPIMDTQAQVTALFRRYTQQILLGCQHEDCSEVLCHTGRLNRSPKPVRRYDARSARHVALAVCSSREPEKHLCQYMPENGSTADNRHYETPRDPSSLPQLMSDTRSIKGLTNDLSSVSLDPELVQLHREVSKCAIIAGRLPTLNPENRRLATIHIVDGLVPCFQWLLSKARLEWPGQWNWVNRDIISKGYAYPSKRESIPADKEYNTWLVILDLLERVPYLRLLERIMLALGRCHEADLTRQECNHGDTSFDGSVECQLSRKLCSQFTSTGVLAIIVWLKKLFTKLWDSTATLRTGSVCYEILQTIRAISECRNPQGTTDWSDDSFRMPVIQCRLGHLELATSFLKDVASGEVHILSWGFAFSPAALSWYFRTINHITMREAHSGVEKTGALHRRYAQLLEWPRLDPSPEQLKHSERHYLLLAVSRGHVLSDAFDQLWQRRRNELKRPLRVRLGEMDELEIGHDLGGVQMEFFNLVCKEAFAEEAGMFTTDPTTGCSYFRPGSLQPLHIFELLGLLVALALYNGITLPICLPQILYTYMQKGTARHSDVTPKDVEDAFPVVAKSLQSILDDGVFGLEFTYPIEANGLRMTIKDVASVRWRKHGHRMTVTDATFTEGDCAVDFADIRLAWPGWEIVKAKPSQLIEIEDVENENRAKYVSDYVQFLAYDSVAPQLDAFLQGFHSAGLFDRFSALHIFTPEQLKLHLEGTSLFNVKELREAARYDGYEAKSRYMQSFWRIVAGWPEAKQKQLLKFVTAAERIPITGARNLTFIIKKATPENMDSLPTSSTCFGTLMLPRYSDAQVLNTKLSLAVKYASEGFGNG